MGQAGCCRCRLPGPGLPTRHYHHNEGNRLPPVGARSVEKHHFDTGGKCWVFPADESKGEREPRVVLLNDKALALCQRLALKHPEGPLFRNSDGAPWTRQTLDYRLYRLSKRLRVPLLPLCDSPHFLPRTAFARALTFRPSQP